MSADCSSLFFGAPVLDENVMPAALLQSISASLEYWIRLFHACIRTCVDMTNGIMKPEGDRIIR